MELYLDLYSPPCRAVYLLAKALGIPFEFKVVSLTAGDQYSEEFGKLSIVKKVPVMKDGSFVLTESTAIMKYMVQKHSAADHWFPADLQQRARVNEYLSWQHLNLRAHCSKVFLFRVLYPFVMGAEAPKERLDLSIEDMKQSLDLLEQKFLQSKLFIAGNKISLADVVAVVEVMQPLSAGVDGLEGRPKLTAWRERVKKELGEKVFDEAHEKALDRSGMTQKMQDDPEILKFKQNLQKLFR
ncbi:glutathione S-transferase theta-1a [Melanotaenia boesemani]|uniref:glutathione S-transferase theta-1a n=1 Tax=Melanotaenia boesemani TaxID=1250792 RepID=UPI001C03B25D|nr:glutathione S-transferase theta-1a [Melanotaenia boesemani]